MATGSSTEESQHAGDKAKERGSMVSKASGEKKLGCRRTGEDLERGDQGSAVWEKPKTTKLLGELREAYSSENDFWQLRNKRTRTKWVSKGLVQEGAFRTQGKGDSLFSRRDAPYQIVWLASI